MDKNELEESSKDAVLLSGSYIDVLWGTRYYTKACTSNFAAVAQVRSTCHIFTCTSYMLVRVVLMIPYYAGACESV